MAFTGISSNEYFNASAIQRDISALMAALSPKETPILDWIGSPGRFATNIKHEWVQDQMLPNYIVNSTAINSATANTAFQINGLGLALNVGQLIENESAAPEVMQVVSIVGANSILVSRAYDGGTVGSLAPGGSLYVREAAGVEGADHSGADTRRLGTQAANTVGLFRIELSQSNTAFSVNQIGNDGWEARKAKGLVDIMHQLEKAFIRGKLNGSNSLGTTGASGTTRTTQGVKSFISTVNSAVTASSFTANPHLYIGNVMAQVHANGASIANEDWGIVAGTQFFRDISDLNDTKVQDSNQSEEFKRVIRTYVGPLGRAQVFHSRVLASTELLLLSRDRVALLPLQGRSVMYEDMAKTGDNRKGLFTGEYVVELSHEAAAARLYV